MVENRIWLPGKWLKNHFSITLAQVMSHICRNPYQGWGLRTSRSVDPDTLPLSDRPEGEKCWASWMHLQRNCSPSPGTKSKGCMACMVSLDLSPSRKYKGHFLFSKEIRGLGGEQLLEEHSSSATELKVSCLGYYLFASLTYPNCIFLVSALLLPTCVFHFNLSIVLYHIGIWELERRVIILFLCIYICT